MVDIRGYRWLFIEIVQSVLGKGYTLMRIFVTGF